MGKWKPPVDAVASDNNKEWTPPSDAIAEGDEKKKSINEDSSRPSKPLVLNQSLEEKKPASPYQTPDIQSQSNLDVSTSESTPSQSVVIKSNYSVTPSELKAPSAQSTKIDKYSDLEKEVDSKIEDRRNLLGNVKQNLSSFNDEALSIENELKRTDLTKEEREKLGADYESAISHYNEEQARLNQVEKEAAPILFSKDIIKQLREVESIATEKMKSGPEVAGDSFLRGVGKAVSSLLKTPAFAYDLVTSIAVNPFTELAGYKTDSEILAKSLGFDPDQEQLSDVIDAKVDDSYENYRKRYDKQFEEYWSEGDYNKAFSVLGNEVMESVPVSLAMMISRGAGATAAEGTLAGGLVFGADKKSELNYSNPNMSEQDKNLVSFANGLAEGIFEQVGVTKLGGVVKNIFAKEGKEAAEKMAAEGFKQTYGAAIKKYLGVTSEEAIGEMATQFAQNSIDKYSGVDPNKNLMDGVLHAGIVGLGSSVAFTAPVAPLELLQVKNQRALYDKAQEIKNDKEKRDAFRAEIDQTLTPEQAQKVKDKVNEVIVHDEKIPDYIKKAERRLAAVQLIGEKAKLEQQIEGKDKALTVKKRERIDEINSELEGIARGKKLPKEETVEAIDVKSEKKQDVSFSQEEQEDFDLLTFKDELGKLKPEDKIKLDELKARQPIKKEVVVEEVKPNIQPEEVVVEDSKAVEDSQQLFPKSEAKIESAQERNQTVTNNVQEEYAPEKRKFVDDKINELKADQEADFSESLMPVYNKIFAQKYENTRNKAEVQLGAGTSSNQENSQNIGEGSAKRIRTGKPKANQKIKHPGYIKAIEAEVTTAYDKALQYFVNRGKISNSAIQELFGKSNSESQARIGLQNKTTGKSIDQLAQYLWEQDDRFDTQQYRNAIEDAIREHNTVFQMADKINESYSKAEEQAMSDEDNAYYSELDKIAMADEASDVWETLSDEEKQGWMDSIEDAPENILQEKEKSIKEKSAMVAKSIRESGRFFDDKAMSAVPLLREAWKVAHEAAALIVEAGGTIADATIKAIESFKQSEYYKGLSEKGRKNIEKEIVDSIGEFMPKEKVVNDGKKPSLPAGERVRALATELSEAKGISKEIKEKIKEIGLRSDTFSHAEAKDIANYLIKERGVEEAVQLADKELKGSVKFFVFGAAIDHYSKMIEEAKTTEEKERYAELGSEVGMLADSYSEDYGRFISAIGEYYKNHPDIIARRETKKLNSRNEKILKDKVVTIENIKNVEKEFAKLKDNFDKEVEKGVNEEFNKIGEKLFGKEAIAKVDKVADDIIAQIKGGTFASIIPPPVLIGAVNTIRLAIKGGMGLANAIQAGVDYIKEKFTDFDEKELTQKLTKVFEKEIPFAVSESKKEVKIPKEKFKNDLVKEQEKILNKYFPKKRLESETKRKTLHEKIIDQYNAGVFEGGKNKEGNTFESLFYEKLGIVNPNTKEVQAKLKGFADKMAKAEEGSIMWREVNEEMLNYLANLAYTTKLASGASKLDAMWYANILSSPATHLRNAQYNMIQTRILNPLLLAEKALTKGDVKEAAKIFADMFKRINLPFTEKSKEKTAEARRAFWTGKGSRFDNVMAQSILERSGGKLFKLIPYKAFTIPGRGLRAADIQSTQRAYNLKLEEQAREIVKKQFPGASFDEVNAKVNELIGNTEERKIVAREKAQKEIEKFYGENWAKVPQIENIKKIREFELMELSMPEELKAKKDEVMDWAKRSVLTNKPTGIYGTISDLIKVANNKLWFTKFVVPFINVPLNVTQKLIDKTPVGLAKVLRGKEGSSLFGGNVTELTADQKQELLLKSINYTLAMAAMALLNGDDDDDDLVITGEQTGNYTDNKGITRGGKLEPYTVYIKGKKVLSYKTTPLAAVFLPAGYIRDYKVYGKNEGALASTADMAYNYLAFISDQSAMQGVAGIFEGVKDASKSSVEKLGSTLAKMTSGLIPYSGAVKYVTNTTNAVMGDTDKRPIDWYENAYRDIPFATYAMETRTDHFGQPVKETFDIPLVPVGDRGLLAEISDKSKYYKLTSDHKYMPKYEDDKKLYIGGKEIDISKKELNGLNVKRGKLVKEALDSENVFQLRHDSDEPPIVTEESKMTTYDYLNTLDNDEFKEKMNRLFNEAFKKAKLDLYGEKVGISQKEIDDYYKKIKIKMDKGYSESEAVRTIISPFAKEKEQYKKRGTILIEIDNY